MGVFSWELRTPTPALSRSAGGSGSAAAEDVTCTFIFRRRLQISFARFLDNVVARSPGQCHDRERGILVGV